MPSFVLLLVCQTATYRNGTTIRKASGHLQRRIFDYPVTQGPESEDLAGTGESIIAVHGLCSDGDSNCGTMDQVKFGGLSNKDSLLR